MRHSNGKKREGERRKAGDVFAAKKADIKNSNICSVCGTKKNCYGWCPLVTWSRGMRRPLKPVARLLRFDGDFDNLTESLYKKFHFTKKIAEL